MSLNNFRDIGRRGSDMHAGFQFEFHCENCPRTWQSTFRPYRRGQIAGFIHRFAHFLGDRGSMFRASNAVADAGANSAREAALAEAIEEAERRYTYCPSCQKTVCENCWDVHARLCESCAGKGARAPGADRDEQVRADSSARVDPGGKARAGAAGGSGLRCPNCSAAIDVGRFCAECGFDMASTHKTCPSCGTLCARATRFCTDCGHGF